MPSCAIAIDIGTTYWKAAAFSIGGDLLSLHRHQTITHYDRSGKGYYDPTEVWETATQLIRKVVSDLDEGSEIMGVATASIGESLVPVDKTGEPLDQIPAWFSVSNLTKKVLENNAALIYQITGLDPNPIFSASKIVGMRKNNPSLNSTTYTWLPVADYINFKLTGEFATDYSLASRTHLFDIHTNQWSSELADLFEIPIETLPNVLRSGTLLGSVRKQAATETNLPEGTAVYIGGHDHYCGYLASGCLKEYLTLDSSGTAESLITVLPEGNIPKHFTGNRVGRFLDPNLFATMAGIISSGNTVDWGFKRFCTNQNETTIDYEACISMIKPGKKASGNLLFMPHLRGTGSPIWNPSSRGAFVGLNDRHNNSDLISAIIEGLCFDLKILIHSRVQAFGITIPGLTTIGGGARNLPWQEIKATILQKPIKIPKVSEATLQGAALLTLVERTGTTNLSNVFERNDAAVIEPIVKHIDFYNDLFEIYLDLYESIRPISSKLIALSEEEKTCL